jgi:hypothetical protein
MLEPEDKMISLHIGNLRKKNCFFRFLALIWLPLLAVIGVVLGYVGLIPFKVQIHSVVMISIIFVIYFLFLKHNAYYSVCKFVKQEEDLEDALNDYVNKNRLTLAGITKSNAPFDNFMQDFSSTLRNDNFASVAGGVFPTLGILGTFISIALTMPDFSSADSVGLEREISKLLGGVGTAFYVSIYGIFLSLWWLYFEKGGMSQFERDVRGVKDRVRGYFWSKEEIEQVHFVKSMENFEHLNQVFSKITANEFIDNLQHILQQRVDLFESVIHHEQQVLQKTTSHFNAIIKESENAIQKQKEILNTNDELSTSTKIVANQLDLSTHILRDILEKLSKKEDELNKKVSKVYEPRIIDNR